MEYLEERGYTLVERDHRTRHGEIDLVMRDQVTLVLISKYKSATSPHYNFMRSSVREYLQHLATTLNHKVLRYDDMTWAKNLTRRAVGP